MIEKENKTSGTRLKECMRMRNMKNGELAAKLQEYGSKIQTDFISHMRGDRSPISNHNAALLAKALRIDKGYLLGDDKFVARNYEEYFTVMNKTEQINKYSPSLQQIANILDLAGYSLIANFNAEVTKETDKKKIQTPFSITVFDGTESAEIPYNKMIEIEEQVRQFATTLIHAAVVSNQPKEMTIEEFEKTRQTVMKNK